MKLLKFMSDKLSSTLSTQRGFSLLEVLVVMGIIVIIGTMSTQIFLSIIRSNNKTTIQNEIKQNGNFVIDLLERDIRSSTLATTPTATQLVLTKPDGTTTTYSCTVGVTDNGQITKDSKDLTNTNITSGVKLTACSFSLQGSAPILVTIDFTLTQAHNAPNRSDFTVTQVFETSVSLRSF